MYVTGEDVHADEVMDMNDPSGAVALNALVTA